jgi:hypothetical protein
MAQQAKSQNGMNPLPSLLRASAWDAANMRMRAAGRSKWTRGDYNEAARTQERLIRACYGRKSDQDKNVVYIRFQIAEQLERSGHLHLRSDMTAVHEYIDQVLAA